MRRVPGVRERRSVARSSKSLVPLTLAAAGLTACADQAPTAAPSAAPAASLGDLGDLGGLDAQPARGSATYYVALRTPAGGVPRLSNAVLKAAGGSGGAARVVDAIPRGGVLVVANVRNRAALLRAPGVRYVESAAATTVTYERVETAGVAAAAQRAAPGAPGADGTDPSAAPWMASGVQWGMRTTRANQVWVPSTGGAGVKVCIADSGVDDQHQELRGKVLAAANFVTLPAEQTTNDLNGHGTHVASTVTTNGVVVAGVAPDAQLVSARVLGANNSGQWSWIINGIYWCADQGAHVMNMSIGGIFFLGGPPSPTLQAIQEALDYGASKGMVMVVSAGNSNLRVPNPIQLPTPSQLPGVINVGATGPVSRTTAPLTPGWDPYNPDHVWQGPDGRAFYSNFGPGVQVFGPGGRGGIPLTFQRRVVNGVVQGYGLDFVWAGCSGASPQSGAVNVAGLPTFGGLCAGRPDLYVGYAGTSMASPHVAGVAAILYGEIGGAPTPAARDRVTACILESTDDIGPASVFGRGRVNAKSAYDRLKAGQC